MAQISQPWDGVAIGDASRARYDADEWTEMFQDMFNSDGNRGVLRSRGGLLTGTIPGANQFRIASGAGLVRGRWYNNNANVDFAPLNAGGGNWRRDRIVLSCTWDDINDASRDPAIQTAQTIVLIRLINPAENAAAPGMTQNDGALWEIPLYRINISDAGVVTIHSDDREFLLADTAAAGMYDAYVCVRDVKAQNVDGGDFVLGAWRTRDINDEHADAAGICTIAANQITLAAGTYRCYITCPSFYVNFCKAMLQNVTDAVTLVWGSSSGSGNVHNPDQALIKGRFTLAAPKVLEIWHQCTRTQLGTGFGQAGNIANEIYTVAEFWRES